jgi:hypothetical protein
MEGIINMKKRILTLAIALIIILGIAATPALATSTLSANPTASTVYVDGAAKAFEAYIINGNNYFKLRDLAYVMNGTAKQFEVGYDNATKAITLTTGKAYTPDGGEMANGDGKAKTASPTASRIYLNGKELNLTVYLIGGNNFFKLRDLMEAIDVFVGYDNATKAITLDTSKGYVPEGSATPTPTPEPAPTPEPTPSGNIDSRLIGSWCRLYRFNMTGREGSNSCRAYTSIYIFYEDGTFLYFYTNLSGSIAGGQPVFQSGRELYRKGNYSISGNTLSLTNVVEYHTDLDANDGPKWRAVGTREGALESLRQIPTSGYSSSIPNSSDELNFIETNILAIGEYDTSDKTNVYQKNWEDEYKYYPSQH